MTVQGFKMLVSPGITVYNKNLIRGVTSFKSKRRGGEKTTKGTLGGSAKMTGPEKKISSLMETIP